jgi:hypothetical protein
MSEVRQEGAPAVASVDPANLSGPGVTAIPDNANEVFDLAAITQQNAELRAQLIAENEALKAALADARSAGVTAQGLSDEDVRMLEHPEEFSEAFATVGQHSVLTSQLAALQDRIEGLNAQVAAARSSDYASQAQPQPAAAAVTADTTTTGGPGNVGAVVDANQPAEPVAGVPTDDTGRDVAPLGTDAGALDLSTLSDAELSAELARREAGEQ